MACYRSVANLSKNKPFYFLDDPNFAPEILKDELGDVSPKLTKLFEVIRRLDREDRTKHRRRFKHVIFTDLSKSMSIRLIASAFIAEGFTPAFQQNETHTDLVIKNKTKLRRSKNKNFGVLASRPIFGNPVGVDYKKSLLSAFNDRGKERRLGNSHGKFIRFIILDNGFKEGIDLYDVKYVHLFEPLAFPADQKQAIGRSTRFCGQSGIQFVPKEGWKLSVFIYDIDHNGEMLSKKYLDGINFNFSLMNFASELDNLVREGAVDKQLTQTIHSGKPLTIPISSGPLTVASPNTKLSFEEMQSFIKSNYWNSNFVYGISAFRNKCKDMQKSSSGGIIKFTPTQNFISHFFTPKNPYKGMLLYHSVGSGKTCTAIATATNTFDRDNYTILWVTRHTLKSDIWKNMFRQICHMSFRERVKRGETIKEDPSSLSRNWIQPISYKQFSNLLNGQNAALEEKLIRRNGKKDPLRKTLVIIDEAHKLYAKSVVGAEKPNMPVLEKMIDNSYKLSGKDSVRILLMTATPYTEDPFEMLKLLNLLRESDDKLVTDWKSFGEKYLQNDGTFRDDAKESFLDAITGYVSYLDRSSDRRYFAFPEIYNVIVPSSKTPSRDKSNKTNRFTNRIKELREQNKSLTKSLKEDDTKCKLSCEPPKMQCTDLPLDQKKECRDQYKQLKEKMKDCKLRCRDLLNEKKHTIDESQKLELEKITTEYNQLKLKKKSISEEMKMTHKEIQSLRREINKTSNTKEIKALRKKIRGLRSSLLKKMYYTNKISVDIGTRLPEDLSQESSLGECTSRATSASL